MNYLWETPADGVHRCRLPFLDVTVGLVRGSRATLLVDCGTTLREAAAVAADVEILGGGAVTHLVMTHDHFDHVLGSAGFAGAGLYGAPAVTAALTTGLDGVRTHALSYGADPAELDLAIAAVRAPDHRVLDVDLDLGDRVVHVRHPGLGHTDHDLVVVVPGPPTVVFCGDLVEESGDPSITDDSDLVAWPHTLDRLVELGGEDAVYVPGHGAMVDAGFVRRQREWLVQRRRTGGTA
ncbi:MBL fold metallo-hydrolase [Mycolicibacterium sp. P1-18]|uniref:MBL fold metallo-hydrolase n=1 Tax=Mycolicibacterium sp. P1-18 TaxID=2024615 RepID=UPI0011F26AED|nr:MBL fold metallo-hydrolase [Mycolicibacterium sp. P1-18]KAA0096193.1 MBL fold metallo-hydrolase [Mycolicibacterium sp. P1-18]